MKYKQLQKTPNGSPSGYGRFRLLIIIAAIEAGHVKESTACEPAPHSGPPVLSPLPQIAKILSNGYGMHNGWRLNYMLQLLSGVSIARFSLRDQAGLPVGGAERAEPDRQELPLAAAQDSQKDKRMLIEPFLLTRLPMVLRRLIFHVLLLFESVIHVVIASELVLASKEICCARGVGIAAGCFVRPSVLANQFNTWSLTYIECPWSLRSTVAGSFSVARPSR